MSQSETDKNKLGKDFNQDDIDFLTEIDKLISDYDKIDPEIKFTELIEDAHLTDGKNFEEELKLSEANINLLKKSMKESALIGKEISLYKEEIIFEKKALAELIKKPLLISYDVNTDCLKFSGEASKEAMQLLEDIESIKPVDADIWLSEKLPTPTFSTNYANNRQMEKEARAAYKLLIYSTIFKSDWSREFYQILKNYDFEKLKVKEGVDTNYINFSDLLSYVSSNARLAGKYVLSACNTVFIKQKKPTDPGFVSLLNSAEAAELEKLSLIRSSLIKASKEALTRTEMSWEKGQINFELKLRLDNIFKGNYEDRESVIGENRNNLFNGRFRKEDLKESKSETSLSKKRCGLLFKASLINTEVLSEGDINAINKIVNRLARKALDIELDKIIPEEKYQDFKLLVAKLKKAAVKLRVAQYKRDAVARIREAKENLDEVVIRSKR